MTGPSPTLKRIHPGVAPTIAFVQTDIADISNPANPFGTGGWYNNTRLYPWVRLFPDFADVVPADGAANAIAQLDAYGYNSNQPTGAPFYIANFGNVGGDHPEPSLMQNDADKVLGNNPQSGIAPLDRADTLFHHQGVIDCQAWPTAFAAALAPLLGKRPVPWSLEEDFENQPTGWNAVSRNGGGQAIGNFSMQLADVRGGVVVGLGSAENILPGQTLNDLWVIGQAAGASFNDATDFQPNTAMWAWYTTTSVQVCSQALFESLYSVFLSHWPGIHTSNYNHVVGSPVKPYLFANGQASVQRVTGGGIRETESAIVCYRCEVTTLATMGETQQQTWRRIQQGNVDAQTALSKAFVLWFTTPGWTETADANYYTPVEADILWLLDYAFKTRMCRQAIYWSNYGDMVHPHDIPRAKAMIESFFTAHPVTAPAPLPTPIPSPLPAPDQMNGPISPKVQTTLTQRIRVQNALVAFAKACGLFWPVVYDAGTGLANPIDRSSSPHQEPTSAFCNETSCRWVPDTRMGRRVVQMRENWVFSLKLAFKSEVVLEFFEKKVSDQPLSLPALDDLPAVTIKLVTTTASHPPQQQPSGGTTAVFVFEAIEGRA